MVLIALALAQAAAQARPIELICTHEQTGQIAQGRALPRRIEIIRAGRWAELPAGQIEWSCMPRDRRVRVPVDPD